jgi:hypothetical protein
VTWPDASSAVRAADNLRRALEDGARLQRGLTASGSHEGETRQRVRAVGAYWLARSRCTDCAMMALSTVWCRRSCETRSKVWVTDAGCGVLVRHTHTGGVFPALAVGSVGAVVARRQRHRCSCRSCGDGAQCDQNVLCSRWAVSDGSSRDRGVGRERKTQRGPVWHLIRARTGSASHTSCA